MTRTAGAEGPQAGHALQPVLAAGLHLEKLYGNYLKVYFSFLSTSSKIRADVNLDTISFFKLGSSFPACNATSVDSWVTML